MVVVFNGGELELNERQVRVYDFVKNLHSSQVRKHNGEPYINHLLRVAKRASSIQCGLAIEAALLHDSVEDQGVNPLDLMEVLLGFDYAHIEASFIVYTVEELTNQYTSENYPDLNRSQRAKKEAERLGGTLYVSQSIKCCDISDNLHDIVINDPKWASKYITEKKMVLDQMRRCGIDQLVECCATIHKAEQDLSKLK